MDKYTFTFQASTTPGSGGDGEGTRPKTIKRITTSNACTECRRRKIRCDGAKPCSQCQWYQHPDACQYSKPTQRVVPSRKLLDELTTSVSQHEALLQRLFPGQDINSLLSRPRGELLDLALSLPDAHDSSRSVQSRSTDRTNPQSDDADSLEALEQVPDQDSEQDEARRQLDTSVQRISDDVNGLSLSVDKQSSYVGASSITAALKVIFKVAPGARYLLARTEPSETALPTRSNTPSLERANINTDYIPAVEIGNNLIEAYFKRIHALMPMIDEQQFWHYWLYGNRGDSPWLALLNTVFALGTIASSDAQSNQHTVYFHRAKKHIDIETLGSSNIMVVQALGLLSGYYLHYVNRPNLANNLMGATLRMATVMGMHREFQRPPDDGRVGLPNDNAVSSLSDTRRKTWWSLICLDTWAGTTTGRPTLGRLGPGVTIQPPRDLTEKLSDSQYLTSLKALPLVYNAAFCQLSTRIQDALATAHLLKHEDLLSLDAELLAWYDDLPPILVPLVVGRHEPYQQQSSYQQQSTTSSNGGTPAIRAPSTWTPNARAPFDFSKPPEQRRDEHSCPEFLSTARVIMHWRYQNLRIVLHRPSLLAAALKRISSTGTSAEENLAVKKCRLVAAQTIQDINDMCPAELMAGWNAVWFMYQAVMIPLVSLFSHLSIQATMPAAGTQAPSCSQRTPFPIATGSGEGVEDWKQQIMTAIAFFDRMKQWSVAATKSRDVVARLYEVANSAAQHQFLVQHANSRLSQTAYNMPQTRLYEHSPNTFPPRDARFTQETIPGSSHLRSVPPPSQGQPDTLNGPQFWGFSPSGDAAMDSFWQELQWDSVPIFTANGQDNSMTDVQGNAGTGFALGDFDWFQGAGGNGANMS